MQSGECDQDRGRSFNARAERRWTLRAVSAGLAVWRRAVTKRRFIVALVFSSMSISVHAAERIIRSVCLIKASTEMTVDLRVTSGRDACVGKRCFASIYEGTLIDDVSPGLRKGRSIGFTTSASIQIGEKYRLFADKIGAGERQIVFSGAGYEVTYEVPKSVIFYVPVDGAFLMSNGSYYRTVWPGCEGDASECSYVQRLGEREVLKADVLSTEAGRADECSAIKEKQGADN